MFDSTNTRDSKLNERVTILNTEEKIVWIAIVYGYAFYLTGTLYIVGSLVGWALIGVALLRVYVTGVWPKYAHVPVIVWVWIAGMMMMLVALLVAHADYGLSLGQTIKSTIGWAKGWALLALFPLLGAIAAIRPEVVVRAICILSSQSLVFVAIGLVLAVAGAHGNLYLSPLKVIGGPISVFEVNLFGLNPETGRPRWPFLAPWAPAAGLLSCLFFVICFQEKNRYWRRMGLVGALVMCLFCQSRAGWAIFLALGPALMLYRRVSSPKWILAAGVLATTLVLFGEPVVDQVTQVHQDIKDSRADSTRVRNALANLAVQRWETEAPIWGHGIVEKGPKIVEYMPIGSHHSWYGLLFVKGIVGFIALAVPIGLTMMYLIVISLRSERAQSGALILGIFIGYSFFENLEILAYLFWPALLWLGVILNPVRLHHYDIELGAMSKRSAWGTIRRSFQTKSNQPQTLGV